MIPEGLIPENRKITAFDPEIEDYREFRSTGHLYYKDDLIHIPIKDKVCDYTATWNSDLKRWELITPREMMFI